MRNSEYQMKALVCNFSHFRISFRGSKLPTILHDARFAFLWCYSRQTSFQNSFEDGGECMIPLALFGCHLTTFRVGVGEYHVEFCTELQNVIPNLNKTAATVHRIIKIFIMITAPMFC